MPDNTTANIIVIIDQDGLQCYPLTTGEAITVKFGAGEQKENINLDELLDEIFTRIPTSITPDDNVTADIGTSSKKFRYIYCQKVSADEVEAETVKGTTKVEGKAVIASEQIQINGITLTKNASGRLQSSAGIEDAVWN